MVWDCSFQGFWFIHFCWFPDNGFYGFCCVGERLVVAGGVLGDGVDFGNSL